MYVNETTINKISCIIRVHLLTITLFRKNFGERNCTLPFLLEDSKSPQLYESSHPLKHYPPELTSRSYLQEVISVGS
jgi:hypothetical protein